MPGSPEVELVSTARSEISWRTCPGCGRSFRLVVGVREDAQLYCPTCDYRRRRQHLKEEIREEELEGGEPGVEE
jgi:uncharacterized Zn finger protein (UPF0148 family)